MIKSKIEDFLNWFVFTFQNPYKVVAGGNCPVQAEGILPTGEFYYFRARGSRWSIEVAESEQEWSKYNNLFRYEEKYEKDGLYGAGWMPRYEAIRFATVGIKKYYNEKSYMKNRELKFRVWDKGIHKYLLPQSNLFIDTESGYPDLTQRLGNKGNCFSFDYSDDNFIFQQYTGLKDKNGKEIYEGDVITFTKRGITHGPDAEDVKNAEVWYSFEDCAFVFGKYKSADYTWWYSMADDLRDFEVVGNIFENHNLLDNTIKI